MKRKRQQRTRHERSSSSLIRITCCCGWSWRNDFLKGKLDVELEEEIEKSWGDHVAIAEETGA